MKDKKNNIGYALLAISLLASMFILYNVSPIYQDNGYHDFADQHCHLGIPHFWNVFSNIPFVLVGLLGLYKLYYKKSLSVLNENKANYTIYFLAVALVGIGSAYYHKNPTSQTLVWDRLPMTIAFMSIFSIIISEFVAVKLGKYLLYPLIVLGAVSIAYWCLPSIFGGSGNLTLYAFVQFFPMLAIPIIVLFFPSRFSHQKGYWRLLLAYVIAKLLEHYDTQVYECLSMISGHTLKHLVAALGLYITMIACEKRRERSVN